MEDQMSQTFFITSDDSEVHVISQTVDCRETHVASIRKTHLPQVLFAGVSISKRIPGIAH